MENKSKFNPSKNPIEFLRRSILEYCPPQAEAELDELIRLSIEKMEDALSKIRSNAPQLLLESSKEKEGTTTTSVVLRRKPNSEFVVHLAVEHEGEEKYYISGQYTSNFETASNYYLKRCEDFNLNPNGDKK